MLGKYKSVNNHIYLFWPWEKDLIFWHALIKNIWSMLLLMRNFCNKRYHFMGNEFVLSKSWELTWFLPCIFHSSDWIYGIISSIKFSLWKKNHHYFTPWKCCCFDISINSSEVRISRYKENTIRKNLRFSIQNSNVNLKQNVNHFFLLSGSRNLKNESFVISPQNVGFIIMLSHGLHFSCMN